MNPSDIIFVEKELHMSNDELLAIIADCRRRESEESAFRLENQRALTAMAKDYQLLKENLRQVTAERDSLKYELTRIAEQNQLKTKDIFGRGTEKLSDIITAPLATEQDDEATAEIIEFAPDRKKPVISNPVSEKQNKKNKKQIGKREEDLSKLPQTSRFRLDIEDLDQKYGEGNWRIAHWHNHRTVEINPQTAYVLNTYSPVISVGLEHEMKTIENPDILLRNSYASASLVAEICYQKFFLALPVYRQSLAFDNFGFTISRQTMNNWIIRFAFDLFGPVYDHMQELMMQIPYHQCDETTLRVINDGRAAGSKSYVWVHITSELLDTNPIILFCYELTRGTDHLRKFYEDFKGFITCDAYCSYQVLEKEKQEVITVCGCMMHMRRRYALSLALIDRSKMSDEELQSLIEIKALVMIGKIYDEDESLKHLSAESRLEQRTAVVKPLVDEYFEYIEGIDTTDPFISNRLKDAVNYSKNQKEYLCRFLTDGNIPIDDGATERHIRPLAIARNNFLFCNTIDGAKALAIMYTMVETAKANSANVYYYLKYVLEKMPQHMENTDMSFLDAMMPWSEEYHDYEASQIGVSASKNPPGIYNHKPQTPRKSSAHEITAYGVA